MTARCIVDVSDKDTRSGIIGSGAIGRNRSIPSGCRGSAPLSSAAVVIGKGIRIKGRATAVAPGVAIIALPPGRGPPPLL